MRVRLLSLLKTFAYEMNLYFSEPLQRKNALNHTKNVHTEMFDIEENCRLQLNVNKIQRNKTTTKKGNNLYVQTQRFKDN